MATLNQLGTRVLQKLKVVAANEAPDAADLAKAVEKIKAAHYAFGVQELVQWTLNDIPPYADEPYAMMGAFLAADDFEAEVNQAWPVMATTELQRAVNLPYCGVTPAVYF